MKKVIAITAAAATLAAPFAALASKNSNNTEMQPVYIVGEDGKRIRLEDGTTSVTKTVTTQNIKMTGVNSSVSTDLFFGGNSQDLLNAVAQNANKKEMAVEVDGTVKVQKDEIDHKAGTLTAGLEKKRDGIWGTIFEESIILAAESTYTTGNMERHRTAEVLRGKSNSMLFLAPVGELFGIGRSITGMYSDIVTANAASDQADNYARYVDKWAPDNNVFDVKAYGGQGGSSYSYSEGSKNWLNNSSYSTSSAYSEGSNAYSEAGDVWLENNVNNWNENNNNNWNENNQQQCQKIGGCHSSVLDVNDLKKLEGRMAKTMGKKLEINLVKAQVGPKKPAPAPYTYKSARYTYG